MKSFSSEQFSQLIEQAQLKPRLKRELRFVANTSDMTVDDWHQTELLNITDRTGAKGVLLLAPDDGVFIVAYELIRGIVNKQTGRAQPIICDFCRTWQSGSNSGCISFQKDRRSLNSVTFLCCADLACSKHVRNMTPASRTSRAQLREDISEERRVERLRSQLRQVILDLELTPVVS